MKKMNGLSLYFRYIRIQILSAVQYHGWMLSILQTVVVVVTDPIGTILLFMRFGGIGPWSVERILLIYSMAVTSFGLAETFFRGFDLFPHRMIRTGGFDRVLLRPRSIFLQVAASVFHINRMARVASGLAAITWCLWRLNIHMGFFQILLLCYALASGMIMYAGVFVLTSGISFYTIQGLDWIYIFTNAGYQVTRCPVEYQPRILKTFFTFIVPILVISYYPASVLCGWGEPLWKGLLALPAGIGFLLLAFLVWNIGMQRYQSAGS